MYTHNHLVKLLKLLDFKCIDTIETTEIYFLSSPIINTQIRMFIDYNTDIIKVKLYNNQNILMSSYPFVTIENVMKFLNYNFSKQIRQYKVASILESDPLNLPTPNHIRNTLSPQ